MPISALASWPVAWPKLLYSNYLNGSIALGTLSDAPSLQFLARSDLTGADSRSCNNTTLAEALNSAVSSQVEVIHDTETGSSTDWTGQWDIAIRPSTFLSGRGNEIKLKQLARNVGKWAGSRPQASLKITRTEENPLNEIFYRKKIRIPSNLLDILADTPVGATLAWMEVDAWKTGITAGTSDQDMRFGLQLVIKVGNGETGVRAMFQCDNGQSPITPIWNGFSLEGSIIPGDEYLQETWIKRPNDIGDLTSGRCVTIMTNLRTKDRHTVIDQTGGQFWGVRAKPISRGYWALCYTGGYPATGDIEISFADYEIWEKPPYIISTIFNPTFGPLPWVPTPLSRATYYASPTGSDGNSGLTELLPKTLQGAINATVPGDVVFLLAGTYSVTTAAHLNLWQDGTAASPIIYEAYPGHTVIIDGSGITPGVGNQRRVNMSGSYQKLRGVTVQNMPEYGIFISGNHNTVDGCTVTGNRLSGIITYTSGSGPWSAASYNTIINNHVHHNSDVGLFGGNYNDGGNADGIAPSRGYGNKVQHNLVEYNSDDGIDSWISWSTEISYNVVRYNGLGNGNGNGIKAGGNTEGKNALVQHNLVYSNISVGIDYNTGIAITVQSNTTWNNGTGYGFGSDSINQRNVSIGDTAIKYGTGIATGNSWDIAGTPTFESTTEGDADFLKVAQDGTFDGIGAHYI